MTGAGLVAAAVVAGGATDGISVNTASTSTDNTVQLTPAPLTVTINQALAQVDPTAVSPVNFTAIFSAPVTGFAGSDISFAGSTAGGTLTAVVTGGPTTFHVAVSGVTVSGDIVAGIPAGVATDGFGTNAASTSIDNTVTLLTAVPLLPWPVLIALAALVIGAAVGRLRRRSVAI